MKIVINNYEGPKFENRLVGALVGINGIRLDMVNEIIGCKASVKFTANKCTIEFKAPGSYDGKVLNIDGVKFWIDGDSVYFAY